MSASGASGPRIGRSEIYFRSLGGLAAVAVVAVVALIFETLTPQVISVTPLYMGMILIGYWLPSLKAPLALALLATPLIITEHWVSIAESTPEWPSWMNRGSSIGTVWLTAIFVWHIRVLEQKLRRQIDVVSSQLREIARLASISEYSGDAAVNKNLDGIITSWNKGAERIFGYLSEEVIGKPITILIPSERRHEEDVLLARIRRGDRTDQFETIRRRKDGDPVNVSLTVSPIRDTNGKVIGGSKIARDITERKDREDREHLLMREVDHRTKNMLSIVDAIARQTATRDPEHFIDQFSERIQALSANQNLLIRNAWHGVEVEDQVRAQLGPFADLIGSRIVVRGGKLRLNAPSAEAVGLALHELTTNAGKYGALSTDMGRLEIGWWLEGETLAMSWTERDGPHVSAPRHRGFGTVVMQEIAERSTDGKVDLEHAPSGVTWRLTCPAVSALEPGERERAEGDAGRSQG
jgi:PAS domain S-box-containing protein